MKLQRAGHDWAHMCTHTHTILIISSDFFLLSINNFEKFPFRLQKDKYNLISFNMKVSVQNGNKTCYSASLCTVLYSRHSYFPPCQLFYRCKSKDKNMNFNRERNNESPWVSYVWDLQGVNIWTSWPLACLREKK